MTLTPLASGNCNRRPANSKNCRDTSSGLAVSTVPVSKFLNAPTHTINFSMGTILDWADLSGSFSGDLAGERQPNPVYSYTGFTKDSPLETSKTISQVDFNKLIVSDLPQLGISDVGLQKALSFCLKQ